MTVFMNDEFVPEEHAVIPVTDRSFRYGDGLFETVLVRHGKIFRWPEHWQRLQHSADWMRLRLPWNGARWQEAIVELARMNSLPEAVARVTISRGSGPRGYAPAGTERTNVVITTSAFVHRPPQPITVLVSSFRVAAGDPVAQHKTASRLLNVLASIEAAEHGFDDALLLNTSGHVTEASASNVFAVFGSRLLTPAVADGALPGVTRCAVIDLCKTIGLDAREESISAEQLVRADGVFLTNTSAGVVSVAAIGPSKLPQSPIASQLDHAYWKLVDAECAEPQ